MNLLLSPTLGFVVGYEDSRLVLAENKAGKHRISKEVPRAGSEPGAFWVDLGPICALHVRLIGTGAAVSELAALLGSSKALDPGWGWGGGERHLEEPQP